LSIALSNAWPGRKFKKLKQCQYPLKKCILDMNAYGEQSKLDTQGNEKLQHKFPQLKSCAIEGISDHNLAYILLKQKQLDLFFKRYLFP
jgi:hypothetical protein